MQNFNENCIPKYEVGDHQKSHVLKISNTPAIKSVIPDMDVVHNCNAYRYISEDIV